MFLLRRQAPSQCDRQFYRDASTGALSGNGLLQFSRSFQTYRTQICFSGTGRVCDLHQRIRFPYLNRLPTHHKTSLTLPTTFEVDIDRARRQRRSGSDLNRITLS